LTSIGSPLGRWSFRLYSRYKREWLDIADFIQSTLRKFNAVVQERGPMGSKVEWHGIYPAGTARSKPSFKFEVGGIMDKALKTHPKLTDVRPRPTA